MNFDYWRFGTEGMVEGKLGPKVCIGRVCMGFLI